MNQIFKSTRYSFLLSIILLVIATEAMSRAQSANRECSTCHIMWLNEFKLKDKQTLIPYEPKPIVKSGKQDVASTEAMCFSCHDGFVLDSRFMWRNGKYNHPVGQKPSKEIKIPLVEGKQVFPLNDDGKVYCGTCHSAHGVDWDESESPLFLRMKNVGSSMCMSCHKERTGGPKHGNHPVNKHIKKPPKNLFKVGSKFGRDGRVVCESCHRSHSANTDKLLVMKNNESDLCRSCHEDKRTINQTKHNMAITKPNAVNIHGKKASETGPCSVCHIPHGAKGAALWAREKFIAEDAAAAPCLGCHNDKGLAKKKTIHQHSHPTQRPVKNLGITATDRKWQTKHHKLLQSQKLQVLPLYNETGQRVSHGGNVSCGSCHDPHVWTTDKTRMPDKGKIAESDGDDQTSFLRIGQGQSSNLCTNCHVDKKSVFLSKHNPRVFSIGANEKELKDVCLTCHKAHNGKGPYMQARNSGKGEGGVEKMCRSCHQQDGVAKNKTIGKHSHPIGAKLKKLHKNLPLPMFDKAGRRDPTGGVDCASCHDVHQWRPDDKLAKSGAKAKIDGDGHSSFLRVEMDGNSKLCVSCHQSKKSVFKTEHDLNITAPDAKNLQHQSIKRSGVCGQCHLVHNAATSDHLWARKTGKGQDAIEQACLSCHKKGGVAHAKIPASLQHPQQILAWTDEIRKFFSSKLFPTIEVLQANSQDAMGTISCSSCHNPHQWQAGVSTGPGKNLEGTVMTS
ncbi:MAG: cytochrome c3 family protein, partial [Gammaproteobacteria bacterium]|nr:cytochrome c3 family protein [Gammaproteobacteria bacterium]